ncbi:MAG: uridine kinase [Bacteroidetes bacterium]|nr:uridine kinase [Bacteroidota bacterium]
MLGDILLIKDIHKEAARAIKKRIIADLEKKKRRYRYIVGISGESGSGKSELAHTLGTFLKEDRIRVKVIHTDDYYKIQPLLRTEWRRTKGFDKIGINEYDWVKIRKTIRDYKEKQECMMPCIDIIPEQVDKLITDFAKIDLLVLDGLYAIKADNLDLRVFIDLTYQETKISQIERLKETYNKERLEVLEREHINVNSLKPLADLIVNKSYNVVEANGNNNNNNGQNGFFI